MRKDFISICRLITVNILACILKLDIASAAQIGDIYISDNRILIAIGVFLILLLVFKTVRYIFVSVSLALLAVWAIFNIYDAIINLELLPSE